LVQKVFQLISILPEQEVPEVIAEKPLYEMPEDADLFKITRGDDGSYHVTGRRIERAAAMTYWDYEEAVMRFQNLLEALGVSDSLEKAGVKVGDTVFIGEFELEWSE
ncbi:MAG: Obg family GTPase CgtA, partial [Chitinophagaceae bacterium]|nr:Obg family GTPase CgtA [Anaerolineae bacterium]